MTIVNGKKFKCKKCRCGRLSDIHVNVTRTSMIESIAASGAFDFISGTVTYKRKENND